MQAIRQVPHLKPDPRPRSAPRPVAGTMRTVCMLQPTSCISLPALMSPLQGPVRGAARVGWAACCTAACGRCGQPSKLLGPMQSPGAHIPHASVHLCLCAPVWTGCLCALLCGGSDAAQIRLVVVAARKQRARGATAGAPTCTSGGVHVRLVVATAFHAITSGLGHKSGLHAQGAHGCLWSTVLHACARMVPASALRGEDLHAGQA